MGASFVTTPPSQAGDQFAAVVYNVPITGIATTTAANMFTPTANGTFRLTLSASQTVLGVGSPGATTFTPTIGFTDPSGASGTTVAMGAYTTAATNGAVGYIALASGLGTITFRAKAGVSITILVTVTGGGGTTNPTVAIYPVLEVLGA